MNRTITVKGVGSTSVRPNYITISMTIESVRKDYNESMEDATQRIEKLQDAVICSGYKKEDLKTTSFDVDTRYENVGIPLAKSNGCSNGKSQTLYQSNAKGTTTKTETELVPIGLEIILAQSMVSSQNECLSIADHYVEPVEHIGVRVKRLMFVVETC